MCFIYSVCQIPTQRCDLPALVLHIPSKSSLRFGCTRTQYHVKGTGRRTTTVAPNNILPTHYACLLLRSVAWRGQPARARHTLQVEQSAITRRCSVRSWRNKFRFITYLLVRCFSRKPAIRYYNSLSLTIINCTTPKHLPQPTSHHTASRPYNAPFRCQRAFASPMLVVFSNSPFAVLNSAGFGTPCGTNASQPHTNTIPTTHPPNFRACKQPHNSYLLLTVRFPGR